MLPKITPRQLSSHKSTSSKYPTAHWLCPSGCTMSSYPQISCAPPVKGSLVLFNAVSQARGYLLGLTLPPTLHLNSHSGPRPTCAISMAQGTLLLQPSLQAQSNINTAADSTHHA